MKSIKLMIFLSRLPIPQYSILSQPNMLQITFIHKKMFLSSSHIYAIVKHNQTLPDIYRVSQIILDPFYL